MFVEDGRQAFPPPDDPTLAANELVIFAGTTVYDQRGNDNGAPLRGVFRVRLGFPVQPENPNAQLVGSATVASLASVSGNSDRSLWAVDMSQVLPTPIDEPGRPRNELPDGELYLFLYAAVNGEDTSLLRVAYQANVLILDTTPDLDSLLVRPAKSEVPFMPATTVQPGEAWEYQLTLTGAVTDPPFHVDLATADRVNVPITLLGDHSTTSQDLGMGQASGSWTAPVTDAGAPDIPSCVITAVGKRVQKTATVSVRRST